MKLDVVCCTKLDELPSWWYKNLERIPVNKLVVERSSPLAWARMRAIQRVETEWFAFMDDDVLVGPTWFDEITSHIDADVGAVCGREQLRGYGEKWDEALNRYRRARGTVELKPGERGLTLDTVIRTDLVRDWKPSRRDLSSYEDYEITQHILAKGYRYIWVNVPVDHYSWNWRTLPWKTRWSASGLMKLRPTGWMHPAKFMARVLLAPVVQFSRATRSLVRGENPAPCSYRLLIYTLWQNLWIVTGLLSG